MKDEDVRKLCESFGRLKFFQVKKEQVNERELLKGYAIFQYFSSKNGEEALENLQGLQIGKNFLQIKKVLLEEEKRTSK